MEADFSGYATKANLKCSDGRTIQPDAFKHMDGMKVPLVWQHAHNEPSNVLGHAKLEARGGDMYCFAYFNDTESAQSAKKLVRHGDVTALSIYANRLVERSKNVVHGVIREVSLVLSGANPGALIDNVNIAHGDGTYDLLDDEAVIYTGLKLEHSDESENNMPQTDETNDTGEGEGQDELSTSLGLSHGTTVGDVYETLDEEQLTVVHYMIGEALSTDDSESGVVAHADDATVKDIFDSFSEEQKNVVYYMIGEALESVGKTTSDDKKSDDSDNTEKGSAMKHNVFEQDSNNSETVLSHADSRTIFDGAKRLGSMREAVEDYALKHGIQDIDTLFPEAKAVTSEPELIKRRTEWVSDVMTGTRHTPFSRIKSMTANLTLEDARAKGYVKGSLKKEEFFRVAKRATTPQTVYKKQKLDRDDILDITDFDVVAWLKGEMRLMLEEEIARAILIGDGRSAGDDDKIQEDHIRPIATDDDLYVTYVYVNLGADESSTEEIIDAMTMQRRHYRGSGNPVFYTSETILARLLLIKDTLGRRVYSTVNDLSAALRVSKIVPVEVMDEPSVDTVAIMVNLNDYTVGADKGGNVSLFDDFDIDYNQYKYLIETRISGALTRAKSALVIRKVADSSVLAVPVAPQYDFDTKELTVATTTGVTYKNKLTNTTLTTGSPVTMSEGDEITVIAVPSGPGYYLASSAEDEWLVGYEDGILGGPF